MCGIVGWIDWERDLRGEHAIVDAMAATLKARGPDESGRWLSPRAALGHRRLSVIDPANGQQPMVFGEGDRTFVVVYNGELYNFRELRAELESLGHSFKTRCDTEVLLHSYVQWGVDCVKRFDGIFAFGIWDQGEQQLFLARDRLGVKPLFWTERGSAILFGSELKALLAHPLVPAEIDQDGALELMIAVPPAFVPTPGRPPFRSVNEVRPGRHIVFKRGRAVETQYWKLERRPHTDDAETTVRRVRELLEAAVKRQLVSDVPLACLLSGGVDSSGIAALARRELAKENRAVQTWCIDFVDGEKHFIQVNWRPSRDAPYAEEMAGFLGAKHTTVRLDLSEMNVEGLLEVMRARDLPTGSQLDVSLMHLFKAVKGGATVALSGEAGDELFGGYVWHWGQPIGHGGVARPASFPWIAADLKFGTRPHLDPQAYLRRRHEDAKKEVPLLDGDSEEVHRWCEAVYFGITRWLPYLLERKDRLGMRASVEGRVPFCDQTLVDYSFNIPLEMQKAHGVEKTVLRHAFKDLLPPSIFERKKSAFPYYENPYYQASINERVLAIVAENSSPALDVYDRTYFENVLKAGVKNIDRYEFEKLIQMDGWMREYHIRIV